MDSLESAEFICWKLNGQDLTKIKQLKAHLHPRCPRKRGDKEKSHFKFFFCQKALGKSEEDAKTSNKTENKKKVDSSKVANKNDENTNLV